MTPKKLLSGLVWRVTYTVALLILVVTLLYTIGQLLTALNAGMVTP
jgi:hypothetical protein